MENNKTKMERFDWTLAFILLLFFIISCIAISSGQTDSRYDTNFFAQQIFWYGIGAFIIAGALLFDPDQYKKLSWYLYGFGLLMLIFLYFAPESIARPRNGAKSWFNTPVGSLQPSEFMKTFLILAVSRLIVDHHQKYIRKTLKSDLFLLVKIGVTFLVPLIFIALQPDLGTGLVYIAIMLGMILVSGISWKIILPTFSIAAIIGGVLIFIMLYLPHLLQDFIGQHVGKHAFERIYSWLDPYSYPSDEGYHLISSLQAIGSGEIFGKGYMGKEVFIPERHTDFIFTVIAEEYGFIGASIVISLYFLLIYHLIKIALETKSPFNAYIIAGIISMTTFHVFENIGMTIQLLPITGIPLPFLSYGGSSLMGNMLAIGIVFSIKFYHKKYMFSSEEDE
ncbi:FtsW/RodA/SpoVE family cell cycle protein [Fervidibacillus halotolerans]|uniref:Rod shape-determining protein RodA n=1 Tax=Fervidibacillus halotolerans TaxID=2980027 RepID=A0A9E8M1G6_9BACI|nr:FtsW/RodA/SpoVE family cell cycle protein [Fervidibacillus halotolerans]WAA12549.1 rod shape-determining protein RodA [Fervidibacillus halotolerans]